MDMGRWHWCELMLQTLTRPTKNIMNAPCTEVPHNEMVCSGLKTMPHLNEKLEHNSPHYDVGRNNRHTFGP